ncbi:unnamed protein product, partial [marine sediment metagenome]
SLILYRIGADALLIASRRFGGKQFKKIRK